MRLHVIATAFLCLLSTPNLLPAAEPTGELPGDRMLANYFRAETARLAGGELQGIKSVEEWRRRQPILRRQLLEMLGLDPLPERTELYATVTGVVQGDGFRVEKLHFQSQPQLYVTANLYLPDKIERPLPTILYVCGHSEVTKGNVSFGNKVGYQHHGAWFARHGYVCLVLDTLQLGEIPGMHHGLYRYDQWQWLNYGYTPAGVEAWNCVRALDYLETRPEVDATKFGVTGRSGGGAYSWWITAIDDRIRASVPVAGITDLEDHVVNGCVEGHCDCMYFVNTYGWDYATVAALAAPRNLLIANTDRDSIFPLDGVMRIHNRVREIYKLEDAEEALGVVITTGGHVDSQELQVPAFRWFNHALKDGDASLIDEPTKKYFEPEQLRVFSELPKDERNTRIAEEFVQLAAPPEKFESQAAWNQQRERWLAELKEKCFRGWPGDDLPLNLSLAGVWKRDGVRLEAYDYDVHSEVSLRLYVLRKDEDAFPREAMLLVADETGWSRQLSTFGRSFPEAFEGADLPESEDDSVLGEMRTSPTAMVFCCPRGVGRSRWTSDPTARKHIERRFYLLGQTLDGMQVLDIRRAVQAVKQLQSGSDESAKLNLTGEGRMGVNALYAALFESGIDKLELLNLPESHAQGPYYLNVRRIWDLDVALEVVADVTNVSVDLDPVERKFAPSDAAVETP
ncbi:MAG: alpha/beta hydrolase family protein [Planctomycetia bacterium]|nr:alpha/beta hydrolase family protein [Planctomycetia bacterium]